MEHFLGNTSSAQSLEACLRLLYLLAFYGLLPTPAHMDAGTSIQAKLQDESEHRVGKLPAPQMGKQVEFSVPNGSFRADTSDSKKK